MNNNMYNNSINTNMNNISPNDVGSVKYCRPDIANTIFEGDYPVDVKSNIAPELRANTPFEALPPSPPNGGLFSGPVAKGPYAAIPVPPSSTYYIHYNLRSANPPPGGIYQYIGHNRSSNNYQPMPGVFWLNDANGKYPSDNRYHIKFVKNNQDYCKDR